VRHSSIILGQGYWSADNWRNMHFVICIVLVLIG